MHGGSSQQDARGGLVGGAHSHLTSKNIFVRMSDLHVQIGDYGMHSLKKFCKLFHGYETLNNWSAPEVWESQYPGGTLPRTDSSATPSPTLQSHEQTM